jgi:hypothetical protein
VPSPRVSKLIADLRKEAQAAEAAAMQVAAMHDAAMIHARTLRRRVERLAELWGAPRLVSEPEPDDLPPEEDEPWPKTKPPNSPTTTS